MNAPAAMSVLQFKPPRVRSDATAWLGMVLFLGSWAMMFAALFFAYGVLRARSSAWPPAGLPQLPVQLPAANALVLALSSAALQRALSGARSGKLERVGPGVAVALVLGLAFVGLQLLLWTGLWRAGLRPDQGPYPSIFYALTVFHALHVLVGIAALSWLTVRALGGALNPGRHLSLRLWTAYWHFVGAVWLLMFVTLFAL